MRRSGLSFAILRPACFFGGGGILVDNVAWVTRRLPFVPIPDGPPYRIRPIHVEDYADLVLEAATCGDDYTIDTVGPDRPSSATPFRRWPRRRAAKRRPCGCP